ncbi:MAG: heat-inducible transcription repressor HrcA [Acidobacteria bacterium]|nr:heat-inducible transcription repressor HrcA [Acidobacteriota bacterium]
MTNGLNLSRRESAVFEAIVELYLRTGQPVASREVAASKGQRLSPASIRGVMVRLEDLGFLGRPHPSAGCTPTDRGLRFHIDSNVRNHRPTAAVRRQVEARFRQAKQAEVDDLSWVAGLAADLTREAGVAVRPVGEDPALESLALVPLGGGRVLGVVVTVDRWVEKRVASLTDQGLRVDLPALAARVTQRFSGQGLESILECLAEEAPESMGLSPEEHRFLQEIFRNRGESEVEVAGTENLIENEAFSEVGRIRCVVRVLEDRPRLAGEWRRALRTNSTRVFIGGESPLTAGGNLGMIATLFYREGHTVGAVGIVGPRRMLYKQVVPVVECIGETLSAYLAAGAAG